MGTMETHLLFPINRQFAGYTKKGGTTIIPRAGPLLCLCNCLCDTGSANSYNGVSYFTGEFTPLLYWVEIIIPE